MMKAKSCKRCVALLLKCNREVPCSQCVLRMKNMYGLDTSYASLLCEHEDTAHEKLLQELAAAKGVIKSLRKSLKSCSAKLKRTRSLQAAEPPSRAPLAGPALGLDHVLSSWKRPVHNLNNDDALEEKRIE